MLSLALVINAPLSQAQSTKSKIPVGTAIVVRNDAEISSRTAKIGQRWHGTLVGDLSAGGKTLAKNGAEVRGRINDAESSGRMGGRAILALEVTSVSGIPVTTDVYGADGEGHTANNVKNIGGGAAMGAMLGGIFGGGKGAAIGAGAGAGAGTAKAAGSGRKDAVIARETTLTFKVQK